MNPEINNVENTDFVKEKHPVLQVTLLSKYLAMAIFITMPFIAGWIGYLYAPEKVVEVERVVEIERVVETKNNMLLREKIYENENLGFRFSMKQIDFSEYSQFQNGKCVRWGLYDSDGGFSICVHNLSGLTIKEWIDQTARPKENPYGCTGLYGSCGAFALELSDLSFSSDIINGNTVTVVSQTDESYALKNNVIRTPKTFITNSNDYIYEVDGVYPEQLISTFEILPNS